MPLNPAALFYVRHMALGFGPCAAAAAIVVRGRPSVPNHFIALFSTLISGAGSYSNLYFREGLIRYCESTVFCFISSIKTSSPWILTATTPTPIAQSLSCTPHIIVHMFSILRQILKTTPDNVEADGKYCSSSLVKAKVAAAPYDLYIFFSLPNVITTQTRASLLLPALLPNNRPSARRFFAEILKTTPGSVEDVFVEADVGGYTSEVVSASGEIRAQSVTEPTRPPPQPSSYEFPTLLQGDDVNRYPFDVSTIDYLIFAFSSPTNGSYQHLAVDDHFHRRVDPGFKMGTTFHGLEEDGSGVNIRFTISRSPITKAFSVIIVLVMWCLRSGIFVAAMSVWSRKRKVEPALIAISTALLFALPNVRNSQPGIPSIAGTTSDMVGFFWNLLLLRLFSDENSYETLCSAFSLTASHAVTSASSRHTAQSQRPPLILVLPVERQCE
ncbi:hypothetical protein DFH08DRAFT_1088231 [Mycena albidolilacea]|uniref:Uncharacterized protein n=1 Tax=Mycena albidolilacea TaxID=1033008 RepID=A0AAD6Z799_9AGAR|nr:hypothetical protein DFH08DRAFT_1088231 [Mycena albidolilacea]